MNIKRLEKMQAISKMNQMQLHLLQFFSEKNVSSEEAEELQKLMAQYYFDKAEQELERVMYEKNITQSDIEDLANQHLRIAYNGEV